MSDKEKRLAEKAARKAEREKKEQEREKKEREEREKAAQDFERNIASFKAQEDIPPLVRGMEQYSDYTCIQRIEAIIKAMNEHQDNAGVQEQGSAALVNLTQNNDNNKEK